MEAPTTSHQINIFTIAVIGRLDALRAGDLRRELSEVVESGTVRIVVDLSETEFVDSAGLAALANSMKDCRAAGGDLRIVTPVNDDARRVFELTRFDQVFVMDATAEAIVGSW